MKEAAKKIRVLVLYGGRSAEHEISLQSAASVMRHLDKTRFEVVPLAIDKQGRWLLNEDPARLSGFDKMQSLPVEGREIVFPARPMSTNAELADIATIIKGKTQGKIFDVVFPVLHGPLGEDGTVQGLFELMDVPYVGPGVLTSAVVMEKDIAKRLVAAAGLPVTPYLIIKVAEWRADPTYWQRCIEERFEYPVFVKPARLGSSVGISKAKNSTELMAALAEAFQYDVKVLVEKGLSAREIELAVLEDIAGGDPLVAVPGEIVPSHEFYSYEAKYIDENGAQLLIPAPLDASQVFAAKQLAGEVFKTLECEGMVRVDLFLERATNQFYFNEANTIPGFTKISMYPKMWEASGLAYSALLTQLIELAMARHASRCFLKREK